MLLIKIITETVLILLSTLLVIKALDSIDADVELKPTKADIIYTVIMSALFSLFINNVFVNINIEHIIIVVVTIAMMVMAFTDYKTKEVHLILNILCIVASIVYVVINFEIFKVNIVNLSQLKPIIACLIILIVLFITQAVGLGDSLLYIALLPIYIISSKNGALVLILNILLSNVIFIIKNSKVFLRNKKEKMPLIPDILVAWLLLLPLMS